MTSPTFPVPPPLNQQLDQEMHAAKVTLRGALVAARAHRSPAARTAVAAAVATVFDDEFSSRLGSTLSTVAIYLSVGTEPGTALIAAQLARLTVTTLAPVLRPDADLDWAVVDDDGPLQTGLHGTVEPAGARLGRQAIANADLLLVPALAVDRVGHRLGRGGGSYDRALARVPPGRLVLAVVHDDEVLDTVPSQPHDRQVDGALTPAGVILFSSSFRSGEQS